VWNTKNLFLPRLHNQATAPKTGEKSATMSMENTERQNPTKNLLACSLCNNFFEVEDNNGKNKNVNAVWAKSNSAQENICQRVAVCEDEGKSGRLIVPLVFCFATVFTVPPDSLSAILLRSSRIESSTPLTNYRFFLCWSHVQFLWLRWCVDFWRNIIEVQ